MIRTLRIDQNERIYLDGEEIKNVESYKLESSAGENTPAKLTVTMFVNVGQIGCGLKKKDLSIEEQDFILPAKNKNIRK